MGAADGRPDLDGGDGQVAKQSHGTVLDENGNAVNVGQPGVDARSDADAQRDAAAVASTGTSSTIADEAARMSGANPQTAETTGMTQSDAEQK